MSSMFAWLETLSGDPPSSSQYIVTTNTQPPTNPAKAPYVALALYARDEDGLFLKQWI